jgi:hypothetical protein
LNERTAKARNDSTHVIEEVANAEDGQNNEINFALELPLAYWVYRLIIPVFREGFFNKFRMITTGDDRSPPGL